MLENNIKVLHWNIWAILNVAVASCFISLMLGTLLNMFVSCILDCLATTLCYLRTESGLDNNTRITMLQKVFDSNRQNIYYNRR
jgi:hypothetical protein